MIKVVKFAILVIAALILQFTLLPAYLRDPFQPNLMIILVIYLGLKEYVRGGGILVYLLGLIHDTGSGIYLGLHGLTYVLLYSLLRAIADRLYTDSRLLMVIVTFLATLGAGILHLLLLLLFSSANSLYVTLLPNLLPQGLVNALTASLIFSFPYSISKEEAK